MNWEEIGAIVAILTLSLTFFLEWPKIIARFENISVSQYGIIFFTFLFLIIGSFIPIIDLVLKNISIFQNYNGLNPILSYGMLFLFNLLLLIAGVRTVNTSHIVDILTIYPLLIMTYLIKLLILGAFSMQPFRITF